MARRSDHARAKRSLLFRWLDVLKESELSPTRKLVALILATHMNTDGGSCYPGMGTIARESSLGRTTVIRALRELEERGYIAVIERGGTNRSGKARSNSYEARFPSRSAMVAPVSQEDRCEGETDPVPQMHVPGVTVAPEGLMELSIEQQRSQATKARSNGEREPGWGSALNEDGLKRIEEQLAGVGRSLDDE